MNDLSNNTPDQRFGDSSGVVSRAESRVIGNAADAYSMLRTTHAAVADRLPAFCLLPYKE